MAFLSNLNAIASGKPLSAVVKNSNIEAVKAMVKKSFSPVCLCFDSELSNNNFNDVCDWCLGLKRLSLQRLLGRPLNNEVLGKVCNLISSPQCSHLIDLNLTETNLTSKSLHSLLEASSKNNVHLKYFECDSNPSLKGELGDWYSYSNVFTQLEELCLDSDLIGDKNMHSLFDLLSNDKLSFLTSLHIRENHLHDDAGIQLIDLLDKHAPRLRCLGLSLLVNPFTTKFVSKLSSMLNAGSLLTLDELQVQFPDLEQTSQMNDLKEVFCGECEALDRTMGLLGILYRNGVPSVNEDDLSDCYGFNGFIDSSWNDNDESDSD